MYSPRFWFVAQSEYQRGRFGYIGRSHGLVDARNGHVSGRAQAELDSVVGRTHIPTFSDFQHLPYIRAMVKEMLRWRPMDPLGLPHFSIKDDRYNDMFIPKGTITIANIWHLNRDPGIYGADAAHFNPARFWMPTARSHRAHLKQRRKVMSRTDLGDGSVQEACWNNSLFINIAMMLWAWNIEPGKDECGNVIPIDVDG